MSERAKATAKTSESKTENSASQTKKTNFSQSINSPIDQILFLQRTVGNQAVEKLLKSGFIQAKLTIGQPGDVYEQEADRVADEVMRMPDLSKAQSKRDSKYDKVPSIQTMCTECEEEVHRQKNNLELGYLELGHSSQEELHRQPMGEEEEEILQTKEVPGGTPEVMPDVETQINSIRGGGQPLPESVRAFFEPRFGYDFSRVRVHTDAKAAESTRAVNAFAYTVGRDVVFGAGQYRPGTDSGRRLLAHELTHTLQQSAGANSVQRGSAGILGGKCCNPAARVEWALVGAGVWKKLEQGECTGTTEDCDGMTCGGGFYHVDNLQTGSCSNPHHDDVVFAPRRWTPTSAGASAHSPTTEGSTGGDTPPNYVYDAAATAQCASGVRTITVDFVKLHGATGSPATDLAAVNTIYSSCCVRFVAGATPPTESQATTESWLGGNTDLALSGVTCPTPTAEESSMYTGATAAHGLSSRMRVFYPGSTSGYPAYAFSRPPYCAGGFPNHVVVYPVALPDTLAHEFGHILLNNDAHAGIVTPADTRNLMFAPGRTASDLDATQCATIFGNA